MNEQSSTRILRLLDSIGFRLQASDFRLQVRITNSTIQCDAILCLKPEACSLVRISLPQRSSERIERKDHISLA